MSPVCARNRKRGPPFGMSVARPKSQEETEFVRAFAHALCHATAVIAAHPEAPVRPDSIAHHVQKAYARFRPEQHPEFRKRAKARLGGSEQERRRLFGHYADLGRDAWANAEPGLGRRLKQLMHKAVAARLNAQHDEIADQLAAVLATQVVHVAAKPHSKLAISLKKRRRHGHR